MGFVLQSFLLDTSRDTLPVPVSLLTSPLAVLGVLGFPVTGSWPPPGRCSRAELVHDRSGVTPTGQPMLSWTFSSLGSAARGDGPAFTVPPPVCFGGPCSSHHFWWWILARLHSGVSFLRGRGLLSRESAFPF